MTASRAEQTRAELEQGIVKAPSPPRFFVAEDNGTSPPSSWRSLPANDEDTGVMRQAVAPEYCGRGAGSAFSTTLSVSWVKIAAHTDLVHGSATDTGKPRPRVRYLRLRAGARAVQDGLP